MKLDTLYALLLASVLLYKLMDLAAIWYKVQQTLARTAKNAPAAMSSTLGRLQRILERTNTDFDKWMLYTLIGIVALLGIVYLTGKKASIPGFYPNAFAVAVVTAASSLVTSLANLVLDWYRNLIEQQT